MLLHEFNWKKEVLQASEPNPFIDRRSSAGAAALRDREHQHRDRRLLERLGSALLALRWGSDFTNPRHEVTAPGTLLSR
jgi:hypothetical protein